MLVQQAIAVSNFTQFIALIFLFVEALKCLDNPLIDLYQVTGAHVDLRASNHDDGLLNRVVGE